jgi:hypothetical protein
LLITGADERTLDNQVFTINDTAVGVWFDQARQIENILQVLPDTTTIAVATGASPIEQFWLANLRRVYEPFTKRVTFEWLNDLSLEAMLKRVANLPPHSAIYYNHIHVDARGVRKRTIARSPVSMTLQTPPFLASSIAILALASLAVPSFPRNDLRAIARLSQCAF